MPTPLPVRFRQGRGTGGLHGRSSVWRSRRRFYNRFLVQEYGLGRLVSHLEVPLDKQVAKGLRDERGGTNCPAGAGFKS